MQIWRNPRDSKSKGQSRTKDVGNETSIAMVVEVVVVVGGREVRSYVICECDDADVRMAMEDGDGGVSLAVVARDEETISVRTCSQRREGQKCSI